VVVSTGGVRGPGGFQEIDRMVSEVIYPTPPMIEILETGPFTYFVYSAAGEKIIRDFGVVPALRFF
jgi:hypothetical protein